jgi:hypothetical protein
MKFVFEQFDFLYVDRPCVNLFTSESCSGVYAGPSLGRPGPRASTLGCTRLAQRHIKRQRVKKTWRKAHERPLTSF